MKMDGRSLVLQHGGRPPKKCSTRRINHLSAASHRFWRWICGGAMGPSQSLTTVPFDEKGRLSFLYLNITIKGIISHVSRASSL